MSNRLDEIKAARVQEKAVITALKSKIIAIVDLCGLDEDRTTKRIQVALKSEYGRVNGMINLLAAICKWPAEMGDGTSVATNQALIEEELGLDLMLLEDISIYKGYHTFHTDELEIVEGAVPDYQNYSDHCTIFLEELSFDRVSAEIDPVKWEATEERAKVKAANNVKELTKAVEEHKALLEDIA